MLKYRTSEFPPQFSETVLAELDTRFSRQTREVVATDEPLPFGLVLCKGEDGIYQPFTQTAVQAIDEGDEDSNETPPAVVETPSPSACAILISALDPSETAQKALILTGYAIINANRLVWDASVTDKEAALADLEARGFIIQEVEDGVA